MADPFQLGSARSIRKSGTSLRDAQGRFVLFRGFNLGGRSKLAPYLPVMPLDVKTLDAARFRAELQAVAPQLDLMRRLGVSVVRLLVIWKALEPTPAADPEKLSPDAFRYLEMLREVVDALYARGIFVLLDFHQDIAHEHFGGDGFPDWTIPTLDGKTGMPPPADMQDSAWGLLYYASGPHWPSEYGPLVRATLKSFWQNSLTHVPDRSNFPVRTHLEKTIGQVASFFKDHPAILGYEPFNEPMPVGLGNSKFETEWLPRFYANAIAEVSRFDGSALFFVEPRMSWNVFPPSEEDFGWLDPAARKVPNFATLPATSLATAALPAQDRLIFAFHFYDPRLLNPVRVEWDMNEQARLWPNLYREMVAAAKARNLPPFMTEFGGTWSLQSKDPKINPALYQYRALRALVDMSFKEIEAQLLHAIHWHFDLYNTEADGDHWNQENLSFLGPDRSPRNWDLFARPYPLRSAAEPQLLWFDAQNKHFALVLTGTPTSAPTILHVPQALQFSTGFDVRATSPGLQWDESRQLLAWTADPQQTTHALVICPPQGLNPALLPSQVQQSLPRMAFATTVQGPVAVVADRTLQVPESSAGVDTGIDVAPGSSVEFQASGSISSGVWFTGENGPAGWNTVDKNPKFPLHIGPDAYPFSLIGRFGADGAFFYIGKITARTKFTGSAPRRITLRTNDDAPGNGKGAFSCRVLVTRDAAPAHNAVFVRHALPASISARRSYPVTVVMRNVGPSGWGPGCRLASQSANTWGTTQANLPAPVSAGDEAVFQFSIAAPSAPGKYLFQWRMMDEAGAWFGPGTPGVSVNVLPWQMEAHIDGKPVPLNKPVSVTVHASDLETHEAILGAAVFVDGARVGVTGQPFTHTFRVKRTPLPRLGGTPEPRDDIVPRAWVMQPNYEQTFIDLGWGLP